MAILKLAPIRSDGFKFSSTSGLKLTESQKLRSRLIQTFTCI